jgi:voltage-gated potassium channel
VGLLLVGWLITREVRGQVAAADAGAGATKLAVALVAGSSAFALADYLVAVSGRDQFAELTTKTDAMYFALATLATVGYGDVHPTGQLARALVSLQMAFNLVVLATGASVFVNLLTERVRARRGR